MVGVLNGGLNIEKILAANAFLLLIWMWQVHSQQLHLLKAAM